MDPRAALLDLLLPQTCAHCRADIGGDAVLCRECLGGVAPPTGPSCGRCAQPLRGAGARCRRCSGRLFACALIRASTRYAGPAAAWVRAFKFRGRREAARAAGLWMARDWPAHPELHGAAALVPVPPHPSRRRERGYCQARLLAEGLSSGTGLPLLPALERARATSPLWTLGRAQRARAVAGAFSVVGDVCGRTLLLVDDVCTTGATLEACALALRMAGAAEVEAFVFAREA